MQKLATALGTLAIVAALAGCEKEKDKAGSEADPTVEAPGAGRAVAAKAGNKQGAGDSPLVTLVRPGSDPKQKLRFAFNKGDVARAELRMAMDMRMSIAGTTPPKVNLPVMRSVLEIEVTDANDNDYSFDWKIVEYGTEDTPGVMPQVVAAMKTQLAQLVGAKGTGKIDHRGINLGATFEMPPGVTPDVAKMMDGMRDALSKMSAPLPEEEIGVDGAWKVEQAMVQNGMTTNVEYVYTVTELEPSSVTVKTDLKMSGVPGKVVNQLLPPGATMHLDSMIGTGGGSMKISFANLVPVESTVDMVSDTKATITAGAGPQKTDTHMKLTIEMKKL